MKKLLFFAMMFLSLTASAQHGTIPVFITAGQSNSDGRVKNSQLPDYIKQNGYRHTYWCYNNGWYSEKGKFSLFSPRIYNGDDANKWAYDAVTYYFLDKSLNQDYYVIKETRGGTAISTKCPSDHDMYWSASPAYLASTAAADKGGKSLLKALCENIDLCLEQSIAPKGKYDIKALIWHQGESDRKDDTSYYENLKAVVAYVRAHLVKKTGNKKYAHLPVIVGGIAHKSNGFSKGVEAAQEQLQKEDKHFYFIPVPNASLQDDNMHFDAQGAELLGKKIYNKLVDLHLAGKHAHKVAVAE